MDQASPRVTDVRVRDAETSRDGLTLPLFLLGQASSAESEEIELTFSPRPVEPMTICLAVAPIRLKVQRTRSCRSNA
jgi:hypothetical protein